MRFSRETNDCTVALGGRREAGHHQGHCVQALKGDEIALDDLLKLPVPEVR